jgi:hypothetical protein
VEGSNLCGLRAVSTCTHARTHAHMHAQSSTRDENVIICVVTVQQNLVFSSRENMCSSRFSKSLCYSSVAIPDYASLCFKICVLVL